MSVSFGLASTQGAWSSITLRIGVPACTKRPTWMLSTCVAVPEIGARTVVWSKSRCAASSMALACAYSGNCASGRSGLPSNWLSVVSRCWVANCACNCAVTSAAPAVSTSACEPACDFTRECLRSTSRCLNSTFFFARSTSVVSDAYVVFSLS